MGDTKNCMKIKELGVRRNFQNPEFRIYPEDFNPCYEYLVTNRAGFTNFCFWVILMGTFSRFFLKNCENSKIGKFWPKGGLKKLIKQKF